MNKFTQVAKDLQIKKLAENIRMGNPSQAGEISNENDYAERSTMDNTDETINLDIPGRNKPGSDKRLYKCEKCEASYKSRIGLYLHTTTKHKGICYSCEYCGYKATQMGNLKKHQASIHEGVKYSCDQCDYHATTQSSIKRHQKSVHEGVKYSCDQCDYQATRTEYLKRHQKSIHL